MSVLDRYSHSTVNIRLLQHCTAVSVVVSGVADLLASTAWVVMTFRPLKGICIIFGIFCCDIQQLNDILFNFWLFPFQTCIMRTVQFVDCMTKLASMKPAKKCHRFLIKMHLW